MNKIILDHEPALLPNIDVNQIDKIRRERQEDRPIRVAGNGQPQPGGVADKAKIDAVSADWNEGSLFVAFENIPQAETTERVDEQAQIGGRWRPLRRTSMLDSHSGSQPSCHQQDENAETSKPRDGKCPVKPPLYHCHPCPLDQWLLLLIHLPGILTAPLNPQIHQVTLMTSTSACAQPDSSVLPPSVVLVEDDHELREGLAENLRLSGIQVTEAESGIAFHAILARKSFDVA